MVGQIRMMFVHSALAESVSPIALAWMLPLPSQESVTAWIAVSVILTTAR